MKARAVRTSVRAPAIVALSALLAVLLYLPVRNAGLLSDDLSLMFAFHPASTPQDVVARALGMFFHGVGAPSNQYRPVTMLTFAFNVASGDADPRPWHLVNLLLHGANAALLASIALRIAGDSAESMAAALVAGVGLALFPPAVEAIAWPAARFDALALFFMLAAARLAVASRHALDRAALAGLLAFALALGSKEAGVLTLPLVGALIWQRAARTHGLVRGAFAAMPALLPWIAVAAGYFVLRARIFGDAWGFFPGASPLSKLAGGAFLGTAAEIVPWWGRAFPEARASLVFAAAAALLASLGVVASARERERAAEFLPMLVAAGVAYAVLCAQWVWPANGEGGRVLYEIGAIALLALVVPLRARSRALRGASLVASIVLVTAGAGLAHGALSRWIDAGASMHALVKALGDTARSLPEGEYAFVVTADHVGPVPFARNAQAALLLPPVQTAPLSNRVIVQTAAELAQWPDLFERDVVGRLMRQPLIDVIRNLHAPKLDAKPRLPDRFYCWDVGERVLKPVALDLSAGVADWDRQWARALAGPACAGVAGGGR